MIKIEKNVPIPERDGRGMGRLYPFPDMKVGDSFFAKKSGNQVSTCASIYSKKSQEKKKFLVKKESNGVRCWRVE